MCVCVCVHVCMYVYEYSMYLCSVLFVDVYVCMRRLVILYNVGKISLLLVTSKDIAND